MEDERQLATSCLFDLQVLYDNLVDKPLQTQYAINYLNSGTITQLQFERIQDRIDLIAQAKIYIIKHKMLQNTTTKAKYMLGRVGDFRIIFRNVFEHGLPNFWDEQGMLLSKVDNQEDFHQRKNDTSTFDNLSVVIKGQDIVNILENDIKLSSMIKETVLSLHHITYFFYLDLDIDNRETLVVYFLANLVWQRISTFVARWKESEGTSSSYIDTS